MSVTPPDSGEIDLEELAEWLVERPRFGSKSRELTQVGVVDMPLLDPGPPQLRIALVEATFGTGAHEIYQVPVVLDGDSLAPAARIALRRRRGPPRLRPPQRAPRPAAPARADRRRRPGRLGRGPSRLRLGRR